MRVHLGGQTVKILKQGPDTGKVIDVVLTYLAAEIDPVVEVYALGLYDRGARIVGFNEVNTVITFAIGDYSGFAVEAQVVYAKAQKSSVQGHFFFVDDALEIVVKQLA